MKTLFLVRHGKSSWENMDLQDYERPLLEKGIRRTKKIGNYLAEKQITPDLIISSHALRALETARLLAKKLDYDGSKIVIDDKLYFSGKEAMESLIGSIDDSLQSVMLVGHNPDMTNFANLFLERKIDYLPTTGIVCVVFHTDSWKEIFNASKEVPFVITPKTL